MAKEENVEEVSLETKPKSKLPMIVILGVLLTGIIVIILTLVMKRDTVALKSQRPPAEYVVAERLYQLKDGAYLKLSFSIVVDDNKVEVVKQIVEKRSPGRLPHGLNMLLGNKSRADLINGTHRREAVSREIKKVLEEHVFKTYNQTRSSPEEMIDVREILIHDFVTQTG